MARRLVFGALLAAAMLLVGFFVVAWPRRTAITEASFKKLKGGMALAEVEALLGGPARDELGGREGWFEGGVDFGVGRFPALSPPTRTLTWKSNEFKATLVFSAEGKLGVGYGQEMITFEPEPWWRPWWDNARKLFR